MEEIRKSRIDLILNCQYLRAIGIKSIIKSIWIFFFYGIFSTIIIDLIHGLEFEFTPGIKATIEGPLSLYTFGWLAISGIIFLSIFSKLGRKKCNFDKKAPKSIFYFCLPICEAAIILGFAIGSALLGIAIGADIVSAHNTDIDKAANLFYVGSLFTFTLTIPIAYFTIFLIDSEDRFKKKLNFIGIGYLVYVVLIISFGLPFKDTIEIGLLSSVLMVIFNVLKYAINKSQQKGTAD